MSIYDAPLLKYLHLVTNHAATEKQTVLDQLAQGVNPMDVKKQLAANVIAQHHSGEAAPLAREFFEKQVRSKGLEAKGF